MNILHLSDIHFGRNNYGIDEPFSKKDEILNQLINTLSSLDDVLKPDLVLVTGDIAWHGLKKEFDEALAWFSKLKQTLNLSDDCFVFCPGNHDLNRNAAVDFSEEDLAISSQKRIADLNKCDHYYRYENAHILENRFYNYNCFCERMGMQPYSYTCNGTREYSYLIGSSSFSFANCTYRIICLNTAYLPYGEVLRDDQMFLGLPQIEQLINEGLLSCEDNGEYRIALFHHADRFLHPNEQCEYEGRKAPLQLLLDSVDLALCGHTETGSMPRLIHYQNGGNLLSGGAAYYNDEHPNSFSIINVHKDQQPQKCSFYYNGKSWVQYTNYTLDTWFTTSSQVIWNDSLKSRKQFGFGFLIDGNLQIVDYAYYDIKPYITDEGIAFLFSNHINPARSLDIYSLPDPEHPGRMALKIKHGPSQAQTTASLMLADSINTHMSTHLPNSRNTQFGLFDASNSFAPFAVVPLTTNMVSPKVLCHKSKHSLYSKLQELEEYFGVQFKIPTRTFNESEKTAYEFLCEIMEYGNVKYQYPDIPHSEFYVHNRAEIDWAYHTAFTNQLFSYKFSRHLKVRLFGVEVMLGKCSITMKGAQIKSLDEVKHKLTTWEDGEHRKIRTNFPNGLELWISPDRYRDTALERDSDELPCIIFPDNAPLFLDDNLKKVIIES